MMIALLLIQFAKEAQDYLIIVSNTTARVARTEKLNQDHKLLAMVTVERRT